MANKDDYSTVFRNLRADRTTGRYPKMAEPKWFPWAGGIVFGIAGAVVLYLWVTI